MSGTAQHEGLGSYLLADRIGQGGMATVYKARRRGDEVQRTVVVKKMLPEHAHKPELVEMFRTEARLLALLSHSNIVQFLEFGLIDGVPYIVMEYLDGYDVAQLLNCAGRLGQRLPIEATVTIAREMCQGLGWAHEFVAPDGQRQQIIHRDVSPSNVMLCRDGGVKLLDFGIAKLTREFARDVTALKGKFGYMAPEQVRSQPIDRRVDVFSAGVVLHEMLTGKRLFRGTTWLETLREISQARVQPPSVVNPAVPPELDAIVLRALALDPEARYASAAAMGDALEELPVRGYSRKRLASYLATIFPDSWTSSVEPVEHTFVEISESEVEIIASVESLPALELPREATRSERRRGRALGPRAFTIALSAFCGTAVGVLLQIALSRPVAVVAPAGLAPGPARVAASATVPLAVPVPVAVSVAVPISGSVADSAAVPVSAPLAVAARSSLSGLSSRRARAAEPRAHEASTETSAVPAAPLSLAGAEPLSEDATPPDATEDPLGELDRVLEAPASDAR